MDGQKVSATERLRARGLRNVVINAKFLAYPHGGVARVGCELLRAIEEEISENARDVPLRVATPRGVSLANAGNPERLARHESRGYGGKLGEQLGLPFVYPGARLLNFCNSTPVLAWQSVVWIHDAHVFDAPETYRTLYRVWHRGMLRAVKLRRFRVVTVSKFSRERLVHHGVAPELVEVIYNGGDHILRAAPDTSALAQAGLSDRQYILLVGSPAKHKNVPFAIRALLEHTQNLPIVLIGMGQEGPYQEPGSLLDHSRVINMPRVSDAQLRALYAHSAAVVSPSLVEGFGLYAAEAMFAGSGPLVLSNRGALREVGGNAALYFDPTSSTSFGTAIHEALKPNTYARLRDAAVEHRKAFRWRVAARTVIDRFMRPA